jgi:hypothetical protein
MELAHSSEGYPTPASFLTGWGGFNFLGRTLRRAMRSSGRQNWTFQTLSGGVTVTLCDIRQQRSVSKRIGV